MTRCKLANCTVAEDSRCLEGRGPDCPNLLTDDGVGIPLEAAKETSESIAYPATEYLYSGRPLEIAEAQEISRRGRAIVIALAGMKKSSGKTSLIARLHQQFQGGPIAGYYFKGSRTLWRLEELNWLATVESGSGSPSMERSSRQYDNSFLHFTVQKSGTSDGYIDLLVNDISGETFPEVIVAESICEQLVGLQRADHLAIVVDGDAISDRNLRHDHCAKAKNFIQRALRTGQIGSKTVLHLIISKLDILRKANVEENDEAAIRLEGEFRALFAHDMAAIHTWRLAARPLDGSMPTESVVAELFGTWAGSTFRYAKADAHDSATAEGARDFSRFGI